MKPRKFLALMVLGFVFLSTCSKEQKELPSYSLTPPEIVSVGTIPLPIPEQPCPDGMTLIHGMFCPNVKNACEDWIDDEKLPYARCKRYKNPSVCLSETKVKMSFCIDTEELHDNYDLPYGDKSWTECKAICEHRNKRLCADKEWEFACSGEEMRPYPYGWERRDDICYTETKEKVVCGDTICDLRKPITEFPNCLSAFNVHNMAGSQDEWVVTPLHYSTKVPGLSMRSGLKGGHYIYGRNRCLFATTVDHDEHFHQITIGCRCCKDI